MTLYTPVPILLSYERISCGKRLGGIHKSKAKCKRKEGPLIDPANRHITGPRPQRYAIMSGPASGYNFSAIGSSDSESLCSPRPNDWFRRCYFFQRWVGGGRRFSLPQLMAGRRLMKDPGTLSRDFCGNGKFRSRPNVS